MKITHLFLDLDGTIYSNNNGMWDIMAGRIENYMHEVVGIPQEQVSSTRMQYFSKYGTTFKGLMVNHEIDPYDFLKYVHDVPVGNYLKPDEKLRKMLSEIQLPKWILTNSDKPHATRVLKALRLDDLFDGILDITFMQFVNKPNPWVFQKALEIAGNPDPRSCVFVDDIPKNLTPAKQLGMITILVGDKPDNGFADYHIPDIYALGDLLERIDNE